MKTAVAYCRYSSSNQREESIDAQLRAIKEYALRNEILVLKDYIDQAVSGTTDDRPGFQKMLDEVKDIDYVLVHKLDRFARNRFDSLYNKNKLAKKGIKVLSVLENLDGSPESVIIESVIEGYNEYYSLNLAREVRKGHKENALKCLHNGGKPPLGYRVNDDLTYSIDDRAAIAVRKIFHLYVSGHGYTDIIDWLTKYGYTNQRGAPYKKNSLHDILKNEKYIGIYTYARRKRDGNSYNTRKTSKEIIRIEGGIPRIIDDETWSKVRDKMKENKHTAARYKAKRFYLLFGKLYHECGKAMSASTKKNKKGETIRYYRCFDRSCKMYPKSYQASKIENEVIDALNKHLFKEDRIGLIDKIYEASNNKVDNRPLEKRLREIEKQEININNAILNGYFNESLNEKNRALQEEKKLIEAQLIPVSVVSKEQIKEYFDRIKDLRKFTQEDQKAILEELVYRIEISKDRLKILFYLGKGPRTKKYLKIHREEGIRNGTDHPDQSYTRPYLELIVPRVA